MPRSSTFTQEKADIICERLANGESLRQICRDDKMPDKATVLRWMDKQVSFRDQYARAREAQADHFAEEILEISDNGTNDWMQREIAAGRADPLADHEHIQRSRLRVEARKWLMAKMMPKKYGDRATLEHTGADGGPIKSEDVTARDVVRDRILGLAARGTEAEKQQETKH